MTDLARDRDLGVLLVADRARVGVRVVKLDRDRRLGDAGLAALVHQVLQVAGAHLGLGKGAG